MILDPAYMINVGISVTAGSIAATVIVWKLVSYFVRKALLGVLKDAEVKLATSSFIKDHIIAPFESMNNIELKKLINDTAEKSLELALKKLEEKEKQ